MINISNCSFYEIFFKWQQLVLPSQALSEKVKGYWKVVLVVCLLNNVFKFESVFKYIFYFKKYKNTTLF